MNQKELLREKLIIKEVNLKRIKKAYESLETIQLGFFDSKERNDIIDAILKLESVLSKNT